MKRSEWWKIVEAAREQAGTELPAWQCLMHYYNVCIVSVVSQESRELWSLHQAIGGTKNETYETYQELPAIWVEACNIIDSEMAHIDRLKAAEEKRKRLAAQGKGGVRRG